MNTARYRHIASERGRRAHRNHFVYTLLDAEGEPVYVGMSINVPARIQQHHASLTSRGEHMVRSTWIIDVRSVQIVGPYDRAGAKAVERDTIERLQPRANVQYTARDPRPTVALLSAGRAERQGVSA